MRWLALFTLAACGAAPSSVDAGVPSPDASPNDDARSAPDGDGPKPATCGNDVTDPGEACDGTDVNGFATVDQLVAGYTSGALHCRADCLGYDVSAGVPGKTTTAASCSASDVQAAIDGAAHGDTIVIPAGTCTWPTQVTLDATSRSLALRGADVNQTIISSTASTATLAIITSQGHAFSLSDLQFATNAANGGVISIGGSSKSWRVHHIISKIDLPVGPFISTNGDTYGVVDHVSYSGIKQEGFGNVNDTNWTSWQRALSLGTAGAVVFEDDTIDFSGQHDDVRLITVARGGRVVLRHSTITNFVLGTGGLNPHDAAGLQSEVYDNQLSISDPNNTWPSEGWPSLAQIGGGTGMWFDNHFTIESDVSIGSALTIAVTRTASGYGSAFGVCDGTPRRICSNVDQHWKTLSGAGAMGCTQDTDCGAALTCKWKLCSVSKTQLCAADSDCPGGETCSAFLDGPTSASGYPCFLQAGFGTDMQSAPVHAWNNQITGSKNIPPGTLPVKSSSAHVVEGRDYDQNAPPSYVPYVYPHPLVRIGP